MIERYPKIRKAMPATVLGAALLIGCGAEQPSGQEKPEPRQTTATQPTPQSPTPNNSKTPENTIDPARREIISGKTGAIVCEAIAAIKVSEGTYRTIGRPIVTDKTNHMPVEIMNKSTGGLVVETRNPQDIDWYSLAGDELADKAVDCHEQTIFTRTLTQPNGQEVVVASTNKSDSARVDAHPRQLLPENHGLVQHDFGDYGQVELDELREQITQ